MILSIIGGGSWGTALAVVLAPKFEMVRLWVYEPDLAVRMASSRQNDVFLPGIRLPLNVVPGSDLGGALENAAIVLTVMPSHHVRSVCGRMLPHLRPEMVFVSATKGIENETLLRSSQVLQQIMSAAFPPRVAVLSGPTFAREVAQGEPAAVVIASDDAPLATRVQEAFSSSTFRLYTNQDPIGVEVGASLKNVIAIGAGICQGLGLGSNARAALITRGLAEITRLAVAMGGKPLTLAGLAGLGDLVLTCTGDLSRNRHVGIELASGKSLAEILGSTKMVAEGVQTTYAAIDLARKFQVNLPITVQMEAILKGRKSPREALRELMDRSLKGE
ncbi:MAG TPA: NAD(P)H-dependent glycerol-3-phosphate dehydrogenase [Bryobacteraceae bacterium]|nr:NAD(P)H-dependent glycerol-3-phosphate dehydrogenase [Bryobacteraceae bacterium]